MLSALSTMLGLSLNALCAVDSEICCSGTPYSNLSAVAARLKAGLPHAWLYTNECSEMARWPKLDSAGNGGVPPGLDAISVVSTPRPIYLIYGWRRRMRS